MPPSKAVPSSSPSKSISSESPSAAGALDRLQPREALADPLDLGVDDLLVDLFLLSADLEAFVLAELGRRPHADLEFELERLALALRGRDHLDAGIADRADAGVEQRPFVPLRQRLANRLLEDRAETEPLDHQRGRRFALAEARHPHLLGHRAGGARGRLLDVVGGNLDLDLDPRVGQLCDGGLHRTLTLEECASSAPAARGEHRAQGGAEIDREGEAAAERSR